MNKFFQNIIEQLQFCIGIFNEDDDFPSLNLNIEKNNEDNLKSYNTKDYYENNTYCTKKNEKIINISEAIGDDWLEIN